MQCRDGAMVYSDACSERRTEQRHLAKLTCMPVQNLLVFCENLANIVSNAKYSSVLITMCKRRVTPRLSSATNGRVTFHLLSRVPHKQVQSQALTEALALLMTFVLHQRTMQR